MDLRALTRRGLLVASLLSASASVRGQEPIRRFDLALAATDQESDATVRSRARVEILYEAGDLPGALREALDGLQEAPGDSILLRRAVELETALRLPDLARAHGQDLERAVRLGAFDGDARRWWERQSAALSEEVRLLLEHEAGLDAAVERARWVCFSALAALVLASAVIARSNSRNRARAESL